MKSIKIGLVVVLLLTFSACNTSSEKHETAKALKTSFTKMKSLNQIIDVKIESHNKGIIKQTNKKLELINTYKNGEIQDFRSKEITSDSDKKPTQMEFVNLGDVAQIKLGDVVYEQNTKVAYPLHYGNLIAWLQANVDNQKLLLTSENELVYQGSEAEVIDSFIEHFKLSLSSIDDLEVKLNLSMKLSRKRDLIEILEYKLSSNYDKNSVSVEGLGIFREMNQPLEIKLFR